MINLINYALFLGRYKINEVIIAADATKERSDNRKAAIKKKTEGTTKKNNVENKNVKTSFKEPKSDKSEERTNVKTLSPRQLTKQPTTTIPAG